MSTGKIELNFGDLMRKITHREYEERFLGGDTREAQKPELVLIGQGPVGKTQFEIYKESAEELEAENKILRDLCKQAFEKIIGPIGAYENVFPSNKTEKFAKEFYEAIKDF